LIIDNYFPLKRKSASSERNLEKIKSIAKKFNSIIEIIPFKCTLERLCLGSFILFF